MFLVFHFPAIPDVPETHWNTVVSSNDSPFGLVPFDSKVKVLPSAESLVVSTLVTFPFSLAVVSQAVLHVQNGRQGLSGDFRHQVLASICFHAAVP